MDQERKTVLEDVQGIFERTRAPKSKFRLVEVDSWDAPYCSDVSLGVFDTLESAIAAGVKIERKTRKEGVDGGYLKYYIYDDDGHWVGEIKNGRFSSKK